MYMYSFLRTSECMFCCMIIHAERALSLNLYCKFRLQSLYSAVYYDFHDAVDPPLSIAPPVLKVTTGNDARFVGTEYTATGGKDLDYKWFFNSDYIFDTSNKYSGQSTRNFTVQNAQKSDVGEYSLGLFSINGTLLGDVVTAQLFVCKYIANKYHNISYIASIIIFTHAVHALEQINCHAILHSSIRYMHISI